VDPFSFAPIAAILAAAYTAVEGLATLFTPIAGAAGTALAIVALTVIVRALLLPVGVSQVKAEWGRRRLAPQLQALQRKYKKNPQLLQEKTMELYRREKTSPFAGILPTLAQAPVLSLVYALFIRTTVDGHPNALLTERLFGVPLGRSFVHLVSAGDLGGIGLYLVLFAIMGTVAWFSRRTALRLAPPVDQAAPLAGLGRALSWMPFLTLVFAAFVPLAAAIYLVVTTSWTLGERALLRRRYWRDAAPAAQSRPAVAG
jgi:YidC/Oxa1 family membrane protein insertase